MNKKQEQILNKKFKVNRHFSITRSDYEDMPDPMEARNWSDEKMTELAKSIKLNLCEYDKNDKEAMEDNFWYTMEKEAVKMGMRYYEDLDEEEMNKSDSEWEQIK